MACIRNKNWLDNDDLKADLTRYISEDLSHKEILDFLRWATVFTGTSEQLGIWYGYSIETIVFIFFKMNDLF